MCVCVCVFVCVSNPFLTERMSREQCTCLPKLSALVCSLHVFIVISSPFEH